jgi:hypothetical protein
MMYVHPYAYPNARATRHGFALVVNCLARR